MARIRELLNEEIPIRWLAGEDKDIEVRSIQCDSREIQPGDLFVAIPGTRQDGHEHIEDAVRRGATIVVVEHAENIRQDVAVIEAPHTRSFFGYLNSALYGNPSRDIHVAAVTGTNGKSSTAFMYRGLLVGNDCPCALMGTVGSVLPGGKHTATHTTPPANVIQESLSMVREGGWKHAILEASSHALEQERLSGCEISLGIFTNLTQDHLDYHIDMKNYRNAKLKLLDFMKPGTKKGVYNVDDEAWKSALGLRRDLESISYGLGKEADIRVENIRLAFDSTCFRLIEDGKIITEITIPFSGTANVYNFLAASSALRFQGFTWEKIVSGVSGLLPVPGRFEKITCGDFHIYVDYAHTPDALKRLLTWAREIRKNRVITVFGCGGDRDRKKRKLMGAIAAEMSNHVFVTSDNPRTENPDGIIEEIMEGIQNYEKCTVNPDRREAIHEALSSLERDDILLIAGKGHEDYQILGKNKIHFDDREVVRKWIRENKKEEYKDGTTAGK